jgi:ribosome-associated protein
MDTDRQKKIELLIEWLVEKKATDIVSIDVSDRCSFTEHLIVCTGSVPMHNKAIADHILQKTSEAKIRLLGKEGLDANIWILLDLNDVILHIFSEDVRNMYKLEELWTNKLETKE